MRSFPFVAVVGQEQLKMSLLLNAIDPRIGGVLIRGDKGSGKTTLARGLADLLADGTPFVEVPAGSTEDRVKGSIDLSKMVASGEVVSVGGLLGEANGGVLYVDEVNLLPDHIVDLLLDAAASGINRIERDGVSAVVLARFLLIGSMNPEEGELRPQFLDRFGLCVESEGIVDLRQRELAVRRRLEFDADPVRFISEFQEQSDELALKVESLRKSTNANPLALAVEIPDIAMGLISNLCIEYGVQGLRADITLARAASAHAALVGRTSVEITDVEAVAPLVFAHRARKDPLQNLANDFSDLSETLDKLKDQISPQIGASESGGASSPSTSNSSRGGSLQDSEESGDDPGKGGGSQGVGLKFGDTVQGHITKVASKRKGTREDATRLGGGVEGFTPSGRKQITLGSHNDGRGGLDVIGTLSTAARRRSSEFGESSYVQPEDLVYGKRVAKRGRTVLVALDLSGSVGLGSRIETASQVIESILLEAYQTRDKVAVIVISQGEARLLQRATRSVEIIRAKLTSLTTGGITPLARGIDLLVEQSAFYKKAGEDPYCVVITDGRATGSTKAFEESLEAARRYKKAGIDGCVIDIEQSAVALGLAETIAIEMGCRLFTSSDLTINKDSLSIRDIILN